MKKIFGIPIPAPIAAAIARIPVLSTLLTYAWSVWIPFHGSSINSTIYSFRVPFKSSGARYISTQLSPRHGLWSDRVSEVLECFGISRPRMIAHFLINGTPNTDFYKRRLHRKFESSGTDATQLLETYRSTAFMYSMRLMLRGTGYGIGIGLEG